MSNTNQTLCTCGCCEQGGSQTPLSVENTPGLSALQFRVGTHGRFKSSMLQELAKKKSLSALTSRYDDDMAIATLDAAAVMFDVLTFYQERMINEGFLRTTTERLSVLELASHISYKLAPGVAASTFLSFTMNEAAGNPATVKIPEGTKVQSVPGQDELPQIFETLEDFQAKVEWNSIPVQTSLKRFPQKGDKEIYLEGISTNLVTGDAILIIGDEVKENPKKENWDFRRIKEVTPNNDKGYTKLSWEKGLGKTIHGVDVFPAAENVKVYAMKQKAFLFGYNAPEWRTLSEEVRDRFLADFSTTSDANTDKEWKNFTIKDISQSETIIHLDNLYPKILKDNWLLIAIDSYEELFKVKDAAESSKKEFMLTSKTTAVELEGDEHLISIFNTHIRDAVIYAQSEEFQIAETPVTEPITNYQEIALQQLVPGLEEGKKIIISGKRRRLEIPNKNKVNGKFQFVVENNATATRFLNTGDSLIITAKPETTGSTTTWALEDSNGDEGTYVVKHVKLIPVAAEDDDGMVSELHTISSIKQDTGTTVIVTEDLIENVFDPATTVVYANVVEASHGETRTEVLGSGDGSKEFQKFILKQKPLTYVSAATATGAETTLEIRVNDILWEEASTFYGALPNDRIYTASIDDDGIVTIMFGDGITGSRLPTGIENIKATYRVGIGLDGSVDEDQLTMLLTPQVGLSKVTNPIAASGAEDPEIFETAKENAPLTVLTLDRIVSAKDYEDFTRAFAGVAKASVEILWSGEQQIVHITFATEDEEPVDNDSSLYTNLMAAIKSSSHAYQFISADNYDAISFSVAAGIKIESGYVFDDVKSDVEQALKDNFSFDARDFGQDVTPSEVIAIIQQVDGVLFTDLDSLNGTDPFTMANFRLTSEKARWQGNKILPAQLLTIDEDQITITEITT